MIHQKPNRNNSKHNMEFIDKTEEINTNSTSTDAEVEQTIFNILNDIIETVDRVTEEKEKEELCPVITSAIALIGAKQDRVRVGKNWVVVQDGHGLNSCIYYLDTLDYETIMQLENPAEEIHRLVQQPVSGQSFVKSGSTLCIARIIPGFIEIINVGDSQAVVFINNRRVFCSSPHSFTDAFRNDPEEFLRLQSVLHTVVQSRHGQTLKVLTPEIIVYDESRISRFKCGRELVPTMALGHENMTGFAPKKTRIPFTKGQKVRVCVYSDGVGDMNIEMNEQDDDDMKSLSAQELVSKYEGRWKQKWLFAEDATKIDKTVKTDMGNSFDDVCMGIIDM